MTKLTCIIIYKANTLHSLLYGVNSLIHTTVNSYFQRWKDSLSYVFSNNPPPFPLSLSVSLFLSVSLSVCLCLFLSVFLSLSPRSLSLSPSLPYSQLFLSLLFWRGILPMWLSRLLMSLVVQLAEGNGIFMEIAS